MPGRHVPSGLGIYIVPVLQGPWPSPACATFSFGRPCESGKRHAHSSTTGHTICTAPAAHRGIIPQGARAYRRDGAPALQCGGRLPLPAVGERRKRVGVETAPIRWCVWTARSGGHRPRCHHRRSPLGGVREGTPGEPISTGTHAPGGRTAEPRRHCPTYRCRRRCCAPRASVMARSEWLQRDDRNHRPPTASEGRRRGRSTVPVTTTAVSTLATAAAAVCRLKDGGCAGDGRARRAKPSPSEWPRGAVTEGIPLTARCRCCLCCSAACRRRYTTTGPPPQTHLPRKL